MHFEQGTESLSSSLHLSFLVPLQLTGSISAGGSYAGFSASIQIDTSFFSNQAKDAVTYDSKEITITTGSTIEYNSETQQYQVKANDERAPVPIRITITKITNAFDPAFWTGQTTVPDLATKRANLEQALGEYPTYKNAIAGEGTYHNYTRCLQVCIYVAGVIYMHYACIKILGK